MSENQIIEETVEAEREKDSKFLKFVRGKGIMNLPNQLTILRVLLIPLFVVFFYVEFSGHYFVALAVFAVASFTDFLDGHLARKYKLITNLGKFLDPVADKILVSSAMILMLTAPSFFVAYTGSWAHICAGCCVALILARELMVSGFRMVAADAGIVIAADKIGKIKTVSQMVSLILLLLWGGLFNFYPNSVFVMVINFMGLGFFALATILTVISGVNYIVKNIEVLKR
ncbi:MAG: CDP-diacylglycerol--glycerol-3-phosphate 3-phosphatidyltransferase [Candidatus Coproplasma sp.]